MRRAPPIPGCGISPSPPISLEVSTTTTRFLHSSANNLEISRIVVVFPTPGRPRNRIDLPAVARSATMAAEPSTDRPALQVKPTIFPARLRMALIRCRVPSMPARLSPPNSPHASIALCRSSSETGISLSLTSPVVYRARGGLPKSITTSINDTKRGSDSRVSRRRGGMSRTSSRTSSASISAAVGEVEVAVMEAEEEEDCCCLFLDGDFVEEDDDEEEEELSGKLSGPR